MLTLTKTRKVGIPGRKKKKKKMLMEFQQLLVCDSMGSPETGNATDNEPIGLFLHCLKLPLTVTVQHTHTSKNNGFFACSLRVDVGEQRERR